MLEWTKSIHEAIGIESPRVFIASFAIVGFLIFGLVGWIVDVGYRVRVRQQVSPAAAAAAAPVASQQSRGKPPAPKAVRSNPSATIQQSSNGSNSPNVVAGDDSKIEIRGKE